MPIRFQVDGDFYDHPKTIGMSDAAFSLWVRAGSFSANKLTDGLITEDVLVHTLRTEKAVADELVRRRLWRRVRGGYLFHAWGERNLTKQRVQDDQKADRERKKAKRQADQEAASNAAGQNEKPQQEAQNVRPESKRNPEGIQAESGGIPASSVSVSVSVSESVSGSGREPRAAPADPGDEPPPRCPEHLQTPADGPCPRCGDARKTHTAWQTAKAKADAANASQAARDHAQAVRDAIDQCRLCDHTGLINGRPCAHDPTISQRTARGAAAARANIRPPTPRPERGNALAALHELGGQV